MKNSREEDIKIVENYLANSAINEIDSNFFKNSGWETVDLEIPKSMQHILSDYKRVLKENEELKEKESRIYKEVQESLSFEKFLIAKDIGPDLFNLGRFYISQIIYDILNNVENSEGIHKENKYIKYIDYIPVQKVKDKIKKEIKYHEKNILDIENITMLMGQTAKEEAEIEFNKYAIVVLKKMLQELLEGRK